MREHAHPRLTYFKTMIFSGEFSVRRIQELTFTKVVFFFLPRNVLKNWNFQKSPNVFKTLPRFPSSLDYWGGWACFMVSIVMIGVLTAVIGDLASSFGCTIGLKDAVTAISFVALGTSVPGKTSQVRSEGSRYRHLLCGARHQDPR